MKHADIVNKVAEALVKAGSSFSSTKCALYNDALARECNEKACWVMRTLLENASAAENRRSPLCDDTGIPHLVLEIGQHKAATGEMLNAVYEGVRQGLRILPGRPMAIMGSDRQRIDQSGGLSDDPADVLPAPCLIRQTGEDVVRLHILMLGGGPAIRGKTLRVFHKHNVATVIDEIVDWATAAVAELGCSPCTLAIGIGRSQFEAVALMMEAQVFADCSERSDLEREITVRVNERSNGPMGLGGRSAILSTLLRVGPQRASGVRVVCLRPCCCMEPRHHSVLLL
jgi:fumarate hydratase subunit alpha